MTTNFSIGDAVVVLQPTDVYLGRETPPVVTGILFDGRLELTGTGLGGTWFIGRFSPDVLELAGEDTQPPFKPAR